MRERLTDMLENLFDLLNMQHLGDYTSERIIKKLAELKDASVFIVFCEKNFRNYEFLSGYQKFLTLIEDYKKIENEALKRMIFKAERDEVRTRALEFISLLQKESNNIKNAYARNEKYHNEKLESYNDINPINLYSACLDTVFTYEEIIKKHDKIIDEKFEALYPKKELTFNFQTDNKALELAKKALGCAR